jgi:hypothetical protein
LSSQVGKGSGRRKAVDLKNLVLSEHSLSYEWTQLKQSAIHWPWPYQCSYLFTAVSKVWGPFTTHNFSCFIFLTVLVLDILFELRKSISLASGLSLLLVCATLLIHMLKYYWSVLHIYYLIFCYFFVSPFKACLYRGPEGCGLFQYL